MRDGCLQLNHVRTADPSADRRESNWHQRGHIVSSPRGDYLFSPRLLLFLIFNEFCRTNYRNIYGTDRQIEPRL